MGSRRRHYANRANKNSSWFAAVFFGRAQRQFCLQAIVVACVASPFFLIWRVYRDQIASQPEYRVTQNSVFVLDPPPWFSEEILDETLKRLPPEYQKKPLAAFDPRLVDALITAFKAHPMINDVKSVVCQYPALIKVKLVFRTPVAVVDASRENAAKFLEETQRRLPGEYDLALEAFRRDNPGALEDIANSETPNRKRKIRPDDYYIVDEEGEEIPKKYFLDHPDSYWRLPQILGVTNAYAKSSEKGAKVAVREAAQLIQVLKSQDAIRLYNVTTIYAFRKTKEQHARFIIKAPTVGSGAAFISWGTEVPQNRNANVTKNFTSQSEHGDDNPLLATTRAKLKALDAQVRATAREIELCENAVDLAERAKLPMLRNPTYNLTDVGVDKTQDEDEKEKRRALNDGAPTTLRRPAQEARKK